MLRRFSRARLRVPWRSEFLVALLLAVCGFIVGLHILNQRTTGIGVHQHEAITFLTPAVFFAHGRGLINAPANVSPALEAFMSFEREFIEPGTLPENIEAIPFDAFQSMHYPMIVFVGLVWRLFGVSWTSMGWLLAGMLGISTVLAYLVFRLGMGRRLATICALLYMLSPALLLHMHGLRSFSKTPFFLCIILLLGQLITRQVPKWTYWLRAMLVGALIGAGMGFRQDMATCLLPSLFVCLCCRRAQSHWALPERFIALLLLMLSFLLCAWPVLEANRKYGTPSHDMVMGMTEFSDGLLGIYPGSYSKSYAAKDEFIVASINGYARRTQSEEVVLRDISEEYNRVGLRYVMEMAVTFPADFITRFQAALLRGLTRFEPPRPALFGCSIGPPANASVYADTHYWGLIAALIALLLLFWRGYYHGAMLTFLLVYFLGYTSILYNDLHVYHLSFMPLWCAGFCVDRAMGLFKTDNRRQLLRHFGASARWNLSAFRRIPIACVCIAALLLAPLLIARVWQHHKMEALRSRLAHAQLTAIETDVCMIDDWVLFRPMRSLGGRRHAYHEITHPQPPPMPGDYLAARFVSSKSPRYFWIHYGIHDFATDYSWLVRLHPEQHASDGTTLFFFPVYEQPVALAGGSGNYFAGIVMAPEEADAFLGLYRAEDAASFPLWPAMTLPNDPRDFRRHQSITFIRTDISPRYGYEPSSWRALWDVLDRSEENNVDSHAAELADLMRHNACCVSLYLESGDVYERRGDIASAKSTYLQGIAAAPRASALYVRLDGLLRGHLDAQEQVMEWRVIVAHHPENADVQYWLGRACERAGDADAALAAYAMAAALDPEVGAFHRALGAMHYGHGHFQEAHASYARAAALTPGDMTVHCDLAGTLIAMGEIEEAVILLRRLLPRIPEYLPAAMLLDKAYDAQGRSMDRVNAWRELAGATPGAWLFQQRLGMALAAAGQLEEALDVYHTANITDPAIITALIHDGGELLARGEINKGLSIIEKTLSLYPVFTLEASEAYASLARRLSSENQHADALQWHQRAIDTAPALSSWYRAELAETLAAQGQYEAAIAQYHKILSATPDAAQAAHKMDALFNAQKMEERRVEAWRSIVGVHPDAAIPRLHLGMALETTGAYPEALAEYRRAYDLDKENPLTLVRLGGLLLVTDDVASGLRLIRNALALNADYAGEAASAYARFADKLQGAANDTEAAQWYRKAWETYPKLLWYRVRLAESLEAQELYDEAVAEYRAVLMEAPESPYSARRLDDVLTVRYTGEERIETWRLLTAVHPETAVPRLYLGMALEATGELKDALAQYQGAYQANPDDPLLLVRFGALLLLEQKTKQGQAHIEKALALNGGYASQAAEAYAAWGATLFEAEAYVEATRWYRKAWETCPSLLWHRVHLAESLEAQGLHSQAAEEYRAILLEAPESPYSAERLDAILVAHETPEVRESVWREIVKAHPEVKVPLQYLQSAFAPEALP